MSIANTMTHRERFRAVLENRNPDRIPWVPRLDIWYEYHSRKGSLPSEYEKMSLDGIRKSLGAGMSARKGRVFTKRIDTVEIREERNAGKLTRSMITPVGTVWESFSFNQDYPEISPIRTKHLITELNDYKVMRYIAEHTHYEPDYEAFRRYDESVGDEGFPLCIIGDGPMNMIIRDYLGYENGFLELFDHEEEVLSLNESILASYREMQDIIIDSPAELFLHGMHFDSQMTPPAFFERHILPYYQELCPRMDRAKKWIAIHQDADASQLLELISRSGIHVADCFACYPLVSCRFEDALSVWKDSIVIWGGIPSTVLCKENTSDEIFQEHLASISSHIGDGRVILAVSDNVMPETDIGRLKQVAEFATAVEIKAK
jgi:hypothetical protein